jgi:methylamine dehydrogenase accessory protein MauD
LEGFVDVALLIARLLLALVFVVAAIAKLADRAGSRQAIADFGVPVSLTGPLGIFLPLAELAVAVALIPSVTAWWGALGALALLLLFAAGIGINLALGRRPDCHCFGQLHSAPAGWSTIARNGVLAAVAGFVLWQGYEEAGPGGFSWLGSLTTAQLVLLIVGLVVLVLLMAQWWVLMHLLRQNGRLLVRLEALESGHASGGAELSLHEPQPSAGLPVGSPAPAFELPDLRGETLTLDSLRAPGRPVMLLFTDPDCDPCTALLPEIGRWQRDYADEVTISLISRGAPEENRAKSAEHGVKHVLLQRDWETADAYQVDGTPSAVLVSPDGTIDTPLALGSEAVEALAAQAVGGSGPNIPIGKKVGEPAPPLKLPDLSGKDIELSDFRGSETLVVFWSPECPFCKEMLDDLKAFEANSPVEAPKLLVVSSGSLQTNRAMGLSSPIVLDEGSSAQRAFGAPGTPSAVLVDAEGNIATNVVAGPQEVLELAEAGRSVIWDTEKVDAGTGEARPSRYPRRQRQE